MRKLTLLFVLVAPFLTAACGTEGGPGPAAGITPQPIPPGFDFPADRDALQALVDSNDLPAMRTHAWDVWAGMTSGSESSFRGQTLPVWETWLATAQVFTSTPAQGSTSAPSRRFVAPAQSSHLGLPVPAEENLLVGFNKYDPAMVSYLLAGHASPGAPDSSFHYTSRTSLASLNGTWPVDTPIIDRKVVDAPPRAMELKPVLMLVDQDSITALPFWQGPSASTDPQCAGITVAEALNTSDTTGVIDCHPSPDTWTHCVLIDPGAASAPLSSASQAQFDAAARKQTPGCADVANARYGGLDLLYHFEMDSTQAADFTSIQGDTARAGDHAVLMAMHVNTKEIVDWTWQTFWWQAGQSPPENYPGSVDGMTSNIVGEWRNYAMCTAYSQTTEPGNQGDMRVCFNPFLETSSGIPDGLQSNCVTCHGTARVPGTQGPGYPPDYTRPIDFGSPTYFQGQTRTDFSWAIPSNAVPVPSGN